MNEIKCKERPAWTSKYKENWDEAYERIMAWWEGESVDRPVIISPVTRPDAKLFGPTCDPGIPELRDLREQYIFEKNKHYIESKLFLAEAVPCARNFYAAWICMLGAMAGSPVKYSTGSAWLQEIEDLYSNPLPQFSNEFPPFALTLELMDRHAAEFGWDCILGSDALIDPITTLSMMRGVENLCIDLVEEPQTVKMWLEGLSEIRFSIADGYRRKRSSLGRKEEINWCNIWAPGEMDIIECDFSVMLSPEMFREFALPEAEKEAAFYDYTGWHLDGTGQIRHLDDICSIKNIRAIQWVSDTFTSQLDHIDLFKRIRKMGKSLIFACDSIDEAVAVTSEIGRDGLAFDLGSAVKNEKDMDEAIKRLKAV